MITLCRWRLASPKMIAQWLEDPTVAHGIMRFGPTAEARRSHAELSIPAHGRPPAPIESDTKIDGPLPQAESGAIPICAPEKARFDRILQEGSQPATVLQRFVGRLSDVGSMVGRDSHFIKWSLEDLSGLKKRLTGKMHRLTVLPARERKAHAFVVGAPCSTGDIAIFPRRVAACPWPEEDFPPHHAVSGWIKQIAHKPAATCTLKHAA